MIGGAVRLRDLDATGWALLLVGSWALFQAATLTTDALYGPGGDLGVAALLATLAAASLWVVDHIARPELAGACDHCGAPIEVNTGTAGDDMALTVPRAGPPDRLGEGALSVVRSRDTEEFVACSPTCAQAVWDRQPTPTRRATVVDDPPERPAEPGPAAADGGDADEALDVEVID
jgi:hypothetical protein